MQALHHAINQMSDGEVFISGHQLQLNIETDQLTMRDRLERYERRLCFGPDVASWDPVRGEQALASDPVHEALEFTEMIRGEFFALLKVAAESKQPSARKMVEPNWEFKLMTREPTGSFSSSIRIDIETPRTFDEIHVNNDFAKAIDSDESADRRVSIVAPKNFHEEGGLVHQAKEQSTRVHLSSRPADGYCSSKDNSVDLRGTVYARQSIPPKLRVK